VAQAPTISAQPRRGRKPGNQNNDRAAGSKRASGLEEYVGRGWMTDPVASRLFAERCLTGASGENARSPRSNARWTPEDALEPHPAGRILLGDDGCERQRTPATLTLRRREAVCRIFASLARLRRHVPGAAPFFTDGPAAADNVRACRSASSDESQERRWESTGSRRLVRTR